MRFQIGDKVEVIPHRGKADDGTVIEVHGVVENPHDPTDMIRLDGTPVGHYVRVRIGAQRDLGYHEQSLRVIP
jgi:hypothetical protein